MGVLLLQAAMSVFHQMPMGLDYQGMLQYGSHLISGEQGPHGAIGGPPSQHLEPMRSSPRPSSAHSSHSDAGSSMGRPSASLRVRDLINSAIEKDLCEQPLPSQSPQDRRGGLITPVAQLDFVYRGKGRSEVITQYETCSHWFMILGLIYLTPPCLCFIVAYSRFRSQVILNVFNFPTYFVINLLINESQGRLGFCL